MLKAFRQLTLILALIASATFMVGCGGDGHDKSKIQRHPLSDERICTELEIRIRWDFVSDRHWHGVEERFVFDNTPISLYYGTFNGTSVVRIHSGLDHPGLPPDRYVGGVLIRMAGIGRIYVWKEGEFHWIDGAYSAGLLTVENLKSIAEQQNHGGNNL